jgi:hypothetical protein
MTDVGKVVVEEVFINHWWWRRFLLTTQLVSATYVSKSGW